MIEYDKQYRDCIKQYIHDHMYDKYSADYIGKLMYETGIYVQDTSPRKPTISNMGGDKFMHVKMLSVLYILHKLNVRPPL